MNELSFLVYQLMLIFKQFSSSMQKYNSTLKYSYTLT